ncbi:MAG: radical SAM protein, partial [Nanoarchaeota archaeon]|nr:radical SAM protein [Nanoarchaeota archaeon]
MDKTSKELTVCIDFNCNNDCISCMLKDIKKDLRPFSFEEFREIIDETLRLNQYETLILSGAEVTLNKELIRFIEYAKQLSAFKHIRIQTNGRRLSDINYCRDLMNVGIDEFFVSVYGPDAITHEAITRSAHSFEETLQGIANLNTLGATIITNTVISTLNYTLLQNIVVKLSAFSSIKEMQFWNYWPMSETDDLSLLASYRDVLPFLVEAIKEGQKRDIKIIVKYFPACLLDKYVAALDNSQADTIIDKIYWQQYGLNNFGQCLFRSACKAADCSGLTIAYIKKFGWQEDLL